ncbi:hypothetical protein Pa4123_86380 [Phytohabitans aurantiacus]|uniref:Beta-lactamase-related domain-containing protein n=1 Tax=Phytohabitans aurantiacus TaxID=3016789 RepID=A0ABQ5R9K9_9ACTN|nr:hypothetical protein Pa4123_86380 [Phytohabitans aurantiacus]
MGAVASGRAAGPRRSPFIGRPGGAELSHRGDRRPGTGLGAGNRAQVHAFTYGWIVGELVRRVSGRSIGAFFRDEIADPLGLEWIGLPCRPAGSAGSWRRRRTCRPSTGPR